MEMIASRTSPILIPAWSEIVVEGIVDPSAPAIESGWFACFSGHYRESAAMTAVDVRAVTHRANPIMPAMAVAEGANEHQSLALTALRLTAARLITQISEVVAIVFPESSPAGSMAFISIEKRDPHQARRVASALWGDACLATAKLLLIVDADVDPQDEAAVWQAVAACADPERDVFFHRRADDGYDHAAEQFGSGTAMAIDATRKIAGEQTRRWPDSVKTPQSTRDQAAARWDEYGLPRDGDY
jgi:4-hydroxy-3-polyprenylbenzoate decarboxylase